MRLPAGDSPSADEAEAEAGVPDSDSLDAARRRPALRRIREFAPRVGRARVDERLEETKSRDDGARDARHLFLRSIEEREERRQRVHRAGRHQKLDEIRAHRARLGARNTTGLTANILRPFPAVILRRGGVGRIVRRRRVGGETGGTGTGTGKTGTGTRVRVRLRSAHDARDDGEEGLEGGDRRRNTAARGWRGCLRSRRVADES